MSILVTLVATAFQCGANAPLADFDIFVNDKALVNDQIIVEQIDSIVIENAANGGCANFVNPLHLEVGSVDELPSVAGLYDQADIRDYASDLTDSETIILYELGTTNPHSRAADFQDVVLRVDYDYNPVITEVYPD